MISFDDFSELVIARRTELMMDQERGVEMHLVEKLCTAAAWAPNHQKTWPWLFGVFTGEGRQRGVDLDQCGAGAKAALRQRQPNRANASADFDQAIRVG